VIKRIAIHSALGFGALLWLTAAAPSPAAPSPAPASGGVPVGPVTLTPQPGSKLDATARAVAAADVADGGAGALVLLGSQPLGTAARGPALFVQVQSDRACGSAGCSVSIYLPSTAASSTGGTDASGWTKVLDAVGAVVVQPSVHHGMHDLVVGKGDRFIWNGNVYADTQPAPQVDLRPRHRPSKAPVTKRHSPTHP
jgi:hypothetical protein